MTPRGRRTPVARAEDPGPEPERREGTVPTTRLEAFSDGVFAIAITLLILEIKVPALGVEGGLAAALLARWPSYAAYVVSFLSVGVMWANHHAVMDHVRRADRGLQLATVVFLMAVSFVPFSTAVLAEHVPHAPHADQVTAALFFGGTYLWMSFAFNLLWWCARRRGLVRDPAHPAARLITRRFRTGPWVYLAVTLLAIVNVGASLAGFALLAVYWAMSDVRIGGPAAPPAADDSRRRAGA